MNQWIQFYEKLPPLPLVTQNSAIPAIEQIHMDASEDRTKYTIRLSISEAYWDKRVFLRMDSVGSFASVFVDDQFIRSHYGGYTQWDCDITEQVRGKREVLVRLELSDRSGELSPYQMAAVFRKIQLIVLPQAFIQSLCTEPVKGEDGTYRLTVHSEVFGMQADKAYALQALLIHPSGQCVVTQTLDASITMHELCCGNVLEWDSEHPTLYTLKLQLFENENCIEETQQKIGFRTIEKQGDQVFWNDRPLKLRGINYREPLAGEPHRNIERDLRRFKECNINYIRGLYYPFSKELLSLCDQMGFYVDMMAPVWEVGGIARSTQNAPEFRQAYTSQLSEMLQSGFSHVSVLIWSLGSDSTWGSNLRENYRMVKALDKHRLVNFHYPMSIPEEEPQMDVWSVAHVDYRLPLDEHYDHMTIFHTHGSDNAIGYALGSAPGYTMPVLHTVFAHLPCYNREQIERDAGIHEFWGESIQRFWDKMWNTKGTLGGAVMAAVDEEGAFSPKLNEFRWGILNAKYEPKPEYHHLKMAYAPVKISDILVTAGKISFIVENRFNHTNLNEVTAKYICCGKETAFQMDVEAAQSKRFEIPLCCASSDGSFRITFEHQDYHVYEAVIPFEQERAKPSTHIQPSRFNRIEDEKTIRLENADCTFTFSKDSALLISGKIQQQTVLVGGPYLQTTRLKLEPWVGTSIQCNVNDDSARITLEGHYGDVCSVRFLLTITNDGSLDTQCKILSLSKPMPHTVKANIGLDCGGLDELGIAYMLPADFDKLSWKRKSLWTYYPEDHIGRPAGVATPDTDDDFFSMKHHLLEASLANEREGISVCLLSDGSHSLRLEAVPDPAFVIDDRDERITYNGSWYEMDDYCGNFADTETLSKTKGDFLELRFTGTGIRVYGPLDIPYGKCSISVDGATETISQYPGLVDFPGMSRGYEKRYGVLLFQATGLEYKEHVLRMTVLGERAPGAQGDYISIDRFVVETPQAKEMIKMIINNDFNYTRLVRGNYVRPKVEYKALDQFGNRIVFCKRKEGEEI